MNDRSPRASCNYQRKVTLNFKRHSGSKFKHKTLCHFCSYLQVLKRFALTLGNIFRPSKAANSIVSGGIRSKFKPIQAFIHALVTYKNEEDQIQMKVLERQQNFTHCKSMVIIPDAQGQLIPQS